MVRIATPAGTDELLEKHLNAMQLKMVKRVVHYEADVPGFSSLEIDEMYRSGLPKELSIAIMTRLYSTFSKSPVNDARRIKVGKTFLYGKLHDIERSLAEAGETDGPEMEKAVAIARVHAIVVDHMMRAITLLEVERSARPAGENAR